MLQYRLLSNCRAFLRVDCILKWKRKSGTIMQKLIMALTKYWALHKGNITKPLPLIGHPQ
jgi:hypothetical protein